MAVYWQVYLTACEIAALPPSVRYGCALPAQSIQIFREAAPREALQPVEQKDRAFPQEGSKAATVP